MRLLNPKLAGAFLFALLMGAAVIAQNSNGSFSTANLDRSASACQDFYQFATGGWQKANRVWFDLDNGRMVAIERAVGGPTH